MYKQPTPENLRQISEVVCSYNFKADMIFDPQPRKKEVSKSVLVKLLSQLHPPTVHFVLTRKLSHFSEAVFFYETQMRKRWKVSSTGICYNVCPSKLPVRRGRSAAHLHKQMLCRVKYLWNDLATTTSSMRLIEKGEKISKKIDFPNVFESQDTAKARKMERK